MVGQVLPVQFHQPPVEVIAHQRDGQIGSAPLDHAHAQLGQGGAEFGHALHVDRLNAHAAVVKVLLCHPRRQPEARPIARGDAG